MYELTVRVKVTCADCGKLSIADGIVFAESPDDFEKGRMEAMLQVECPHCRQVNLRFVKQADLDELSQVSDN